MAKNLVIVESPAKAKTINKFLGKDYKVEASLGHVRDLPKSKMGIDIEKNFEPHYIIISKARKTATKLKKAAKNKNVYLAPDPDREGEAISWHLSHVLKDSAKDIYRVTFNEITKTAIKEAFEHPREINMDLVDSQQARRVMDRIVGYEISPLLWKNVRRGLSAGRVQSVALRLIVEREREIEAFVPEEYWTLEAKVSSKRKEISDKVFLAVLDKIENKKAEIKNEEETNKIKNEVEKEELRVLKCTEKTRRRKPQAPYTTSKLQQEAYTQLRFPSARTMRIAQKLYEGVEIGEEGSVGLITYMRTDSVNIAASAQKEARDYINLQYGMAYLPKAPKKYKSKKGAQEAHEAIRPTSVGKTPWAIEKYLSKDEFKLYSLIWKKFVASQMTEAVDKVRTAQISAGPKYIFKSTGTENVFPGFLIVYQENNGDKEKEKEKEEGKEKLSSVPQLKKDEVLDLHELVGNQHFTKPPARYNDASLVKTLEEDGVGRPSTYAPTIQTLLYRHYVERQSGALTPTELGSLVLDLLVKHFPRVLNVEFTAQMEEELDKIEEGDMEWQKVVGDFYEPFSENLSKAKDKMKKVKLETVYEGKVCDICGKPLLIKYGRYGKFLACSGFPECRYTACLPTGFRCPNEGCDGELVVRRSKKGRTFYGCSNYPECKFTTNKLPKEKDEKDEKSKDEKSSEETNPPESAEEGKGH